MKNNILFSLFLGILFLMTGCANNEPLLEQTPVADSGINRVPLGMENSLGLDEKLKNAIWVYSGSDIIQKAAPPPPSNYNYEFLCSTGSIGNLGCFDDTESTALSNSFNFKFLNNYCKEYFVNENGYPVDPGGYDCDTEDFNIAIEEYGHPDCTLDPYQYLPEDGCMNNQEATILLNRIVEIADLIRPQSYGNVWLLDNIYVWYFQESNPSTTCGAGCPTTLCPDPCNCDYKRAVIKLTFKKYCFSGTGIG